MQTLKIKNGFLRVQNGFKFFKALEKHTWSTEIEKKKNTDSTSFTGKIPTQIVLLVKTQKRCIKELGINYWMQFLCWQPHEQEGHGTMVLL